MYLGDALFIEHGWNEEMLPGKRSIGRPAQSSLLLLSPSTNTCIANSPTTKVAYNAAVSESTEPWMQQDDHDTFRNSMISLVTRYRRSWCVSFDIDHLIYRSLCVRFRCNSDASIILIEIRFRSRRTPARFTEVKGIPGHDARVVLWLKLVERIQELSELDKIKNSEQNGVLNNFGNRVP